MSDLFKSRISDKRKEIEALLKDQAGRVADIEEFAKLAKKYDIDTTDLDQLLSMTKAIFKAANVDVKK